MKLSLRKKFLFMIAPLFAMLLFLLAGNIWPFIKGMTTELDDVSLHLESAILAERFAGYLNQQLEEYLHVALLPDPVHRQHLAEQFPMIFALLW